MDKTLYIPIDTTIKNPVECPELVKRGDTLLLNMKIFTKGVLADLTGQSIDLILTKADGTQIEKTVDLSNIANGVITVKPGQQSSLAEGVAYGELQIYTSDTLSSTNTFTYKVDASLADDIIEISKDDIQVLADLRNLISSGQVTLNKYENTVLAIGNSVEAIEALVNIKSYIDTNLPALENANAQAIVNIANETTQNTEATNNIADLTAENNTASTLKIGLEADIASGTTLKNTLEADITAGTTLKNGLESSMSTGNTLKTNLEADIASGTTLKNDIDAENVRAEANIVAMEGFGDVTALSQNVTNLKNEVETARNGEASLDARLDKNDTLVASHSTQLSDMEQKKAPLANPSFTGTPKSNGYDLLEALSGGFKIQTGNGSAAIPTANTSVGATITFPIAFSTAPIILISVTGVYGNSNVYVNVLAYATSTTTASLSLSSGASQSSVTFSWIAIGI